VLAGDPLQGARRETWETATLQRRKNRGPDFLARLRVERKELAGGLHRARVGGAIRLEIKRAKPGELFIRERERRIAAAIVITIFEPIETMRRDLLRHTRKFRVGNAELARGVNLRETCRRKFLVSLPKRQAFRIAERLRFGKQSGLSRCFMEQYSIGVRNPRNLMFGSAGVFLRQHSRLS
jgi:hypothetical protein